MAKQVRSGGVALTQHPCKTCRGFGKLCSSCGAPLARNRGVLGLRLGCTVYATHNGTVACLDCFGSGNVLDPTKGDISFYINNRVSAFIEAIA